MNTIRGALIGQVAVAALYGAGMVTREDAAQAMKEAPDHEGRRRERMVATVSDDPPGDDLKELRAVMGMGRKARALTPADEERIRLAEIKRARKAVRLRKSFGAPPCLTVN